MSTLRVSNIEAKADASSPSVNEKLKVTNSNGDVQLTINGETAGITTVGVNTTGKTFDVNIDQKVSFVGDVITSGSFGIGAGTSISSPATNALTLGTNNAERLRITSSGNVGIGTDNPPWPLSVTGTVSGGAVNGGAGVFIGIQDSHSVIQMDTATKTNGCLIDMAYSGQDTRGRIYYDHTDDFMAFYTNGTNERLRITSDGRVGINTASTDRVLAVYGVGNLGTQLALVSPDTQAAGLSIEGDRRYEIQSTSTIYTHPSSLIFYDRDANALRMKIDENGRVSRPYQLWIAGTPTNTTGSGIANSFSTASFASPVGLSFSNSRITVPIAGVYLITFCTIIDNGTARQDTGIKINGTSIVETLNTPSTVNGYHYRGASISVKLAANDYIQFENDDWYSATTTDSHWKRASVYLLG